MLMSTAAVAAAIGLTLGSVAAAEEEDSMEGHDDMEPGLHVRDAWARESMMTALAGAAYMTIHNSTDADDALVGASSPAAGVVEIHLSAMDDEGMMSMTPVEEVAIPAHGDGILKPGSFHIMLHDPVEPLTEGNEIEITLEFMAAEPQTITAPVLADAPMGTDMDDMDMDDADHEMDDDDMDEDDDDMDEDEDDMEDDS
jgi:hypothetical protein